MCKGPADAWYLTQCQGTCVSALPGVSLHPFKPLSWVQPSDAGPFELVRGEIYQI